MILNLQWAYSPTTGEIKYQWDKLDVSDDEAKIILKEAIRYWDMEELFHEVGAGFKHLVDSHIKVFGFDSTNDTDYQNNLKNYINKFGAPRLFDIQINNVSVATKVEEKEEQLSNEYWENEDADGMDEPTIIDDDVLEKFIDELFEQTNSSKERI